MTRVHHRRWGDNDKNFGPFTYAKDRGYHPFALIVKSGGDEDYRASTIRLSFFGHTFIAIVPGIIKPWRRWVDTSKYEWSTNPAGGYWDTYPREYGVSLSEGFLQLFLGAQTHDSETTQSWSMLLPWTQWRQIRHCLYDLDGGLFWSEPKRVKGKPWNYDAWRAAKESVPTATFAFTDYDGEALTARTYVEEREHRAGEGWFKWVGLLRRPRVSRSLTIEFSGETGREKGSWKGGTVGHSIEMLPGEMHAAAFARYCEKHQMTCGGAA